MQSHGRGQSYGLLSVVEGDQCVESCVGCKGTLGK